MGTPPPLLISLPDGLNVSGVTTWAVRLARELGARGREVALALHTEPPAQHRRHLEPSPGVRILDLRHMGAFSEAIERRREEVVEAYRRAVAKLAPRGGPVLMSPNLRGDSYAIAAELVASCESIRVVAWQHADIEYERRVLAHYEPIIARFCAVSDRIEEGLRGVLPAARARDVVNLPYAVPVPPAPRPRRALRGRPLRLVYTGRMEHHQKRVMALVRMAERLAARRVPFELEMIGDGPAARDVDDRLRGLTRARRLPPLDWRELAERLDTADAFVLASRWEGLSVSMLEAVARGCVPVVTRVESGTAQIVRDGETGVVADAGPEAGDEAAAEALADAVERLASDEAHFVRMRMRAHALVRSRHSPERHADAAERLLEDVAGERRDRVWPRARTKWFDSGGGSTPADAHARVRRVLGTLAGRAIAVHGTGAHTRALREAFLAPGARIVAFADDDPARVGGTLWDRPIVAPQAAGQTGATDVVISSWIHEEAIWRRRGVYERQGLRVWRVYAAHTPSGPPP